MRQDTVGSLRTANVRLDVQMLSKSMFSNSISYKASIVRLSLFVSHDVLSNCSWKTLNILAPYDPREPGTCQSSKTTLFRSRLARFSAFLRLHQTPRAMPRIARKATPPDTPPAIGPVLLFGDTVEVECKGELPVVDMVTTVVVTQAGCNDGKSVTVSHTVEVETEQPVVVGWSVEGFAEVKVFVVVTNTVDGVFDEA